MDDFEQAPATDRFAAARAAKAARAAEAKTSVRAGRRISDRARERAEEDAAMIPTTAEEYRRWERAVALLKSIAPYVEVRVISTPIKMDPQTTVTAENPRKDDDGAMGVIATRPRPLRNRDGEVIRCRRLSIAGDDLADGAPGSMSREFRVGDRVKLTAEAAERLVAQGWVELL